MTPREAKSAGARPAPRHALSDGEPSTSAEPAVRPSVVVDQAGMTYTVRSAETVDRQSGGGRTMRPSSGVRMNSVEALKPLSFVVERGESVGVIGTNGSGKSTLMKLITGQMRPTTGRIFATSTPVMLGVNAALVRQVSGEDNILLGCLAMGMTRAEARAKRDTVVELSGLDESALQLPLKAYSSGMASRLQFAIATSVDPDILVIDEALNTGDAQFRDRTRRRLDALREQAGCVFLVSHSLSTIQEMCSRVIWIEKGTLVMDDAPAEVTRAYTRYVHHLSKGRPHDAENVIREKLERQVRPVIEWSGGTQPSGTTSG